MSKPLLCRLGIHSAQLSQGVVGYCQREGCDYRLDHVTNGRIWTRMVPEKVNGESRPLPPPPPPPPPPTQGVGNIGRAPAKRVEIHIYHHRD